MTPHEYSMERTRAFKDVLSNAAFATLDVLGALEDMDEDTVDEYNDHVANEHWLGANALVGEEVLLKAATSLFAVVAALEGMPR